ncbi:MAG: hypothetical protein MI921_11120 [Cytophagales bacterium]|nr:hypothetical protein [Cytophagales bacterium]
MSFTIIEPAPARLNRSELAVPGSKRKAYGKASSAIGSCLLQLDCRLAAFRSKTGDSPMIDANVLLALIGFEIAIYFLVVAVAS